MLRACRGLSESELRDIADLQQRVVAVDGGRLKLEWSNLWGRRGDTVEDFCVHDGDTLVGFLGIYSHGGPEPELAGMVGPAHRRQGIGSQLLAAARAELAGRGTGSALLICPRTDAGGARFAEARGGVPEHSEFALELPGPPADGPSDPSTTLRPATAEDVPAIRRILFEAFGFDDEGVAARLNTEDDDLVIVRDGAVIGYLRLAFSAAEQGSPARGGVYGFGIDPQWRGRGIGRDVLRRCCQDLIDRGAARVGLEVAVDNESALGLYTSLGFEPLTTEDYFRLTV